MRPAVSRCLAAFFMLAMLVSCTTLSVDPNDPNSHLIQGVPMIRQGPMQCGAASMAMVLHYYGVELSPGEIYARMQTAASGGVACGTMRRFPSSIGGMRATRVVSSDPETIRSVLDQDAPVIARVISEGPRRNCHYVVVVGYTGDGFIINDPDVGQRFMGYPAFERWSHCDYYRCPPHWLLVVEPTA